MRVGRIGTPDSVSIDPGDEGDDTDAEENDLYVKEDVFENGNDGIVGVGVLGPTGVEVDDFCATGPLFLGLAEPGEHF